MRPCRAGLVAVLLWAGPSQAQIVLHPGTIEATVGLDGFAHQSSSIGVSGGGFSTSTSTGVEKVVKLVVEGNKTYTSFSQNLYFNSPGRTVSVSGSMSLLVPIASTVSANLSRPAGTIGLRATASGGSLLSISVTASGSNGSEYYFAQGGAAGGDIDLPMAVTSAIEVTGLATLAVTDPSNGGVLCSTQVQLSRQIVTVTANGLTVVNHSLTVDPSACQTTLTGTVGLHNIPGGGITPFQALVHSNGPTSTSAYLNGNDQTYLFKALASGTYSPMARFIFDPSRPTQYLLLPYLNPPSVSLPPGSTVTRNFTFDGGRAIGRLQLAGPAASFLADSWVTAYGAYDPSSQNGGPSYGGRSQSPVQGASRSYDLVLTPGQWNAGSSQLRFSVTDLGIRNDSYVDIWNPESQVTAGSSVINLGDRNFSVSRGSIAFSIDEPPNAPPAVMSNPQLYASLTDPATGNQVNISTYTYVNNAETVYLHTVGPPGVYQIDGYATVDGDRVKFASVNALSIGVAVNTPVGPNVEVTPKLPDGSDSPLTITFENVLSPGETSLSLSDVGPPGPTGYTLLAIAVANNINRKYNYAFPSTSATYSGRVQVCIQYDPDVIGLPDDRAERRIVLMQWTCASSTCTPNHWKIINEFLDPITNRVCGVLRPPSTLGLPADASNPAFFSPLVLAWPLAPPTEATCVGNDQEPVSLGTDVGVCSRTVDNQNQLAGRCSEGEEQVACTFNGQDALALDLGTHAIEVVASDSSGAADVCTSHVTVVDQEAPTPTCPAPTTTECLGALTPVTLAATCHDNCQSCTASCGDNALPLGTSAIVCQAQDSAGHTASCIAQVTIADTRPPQLELTASPQVLWPPDCRMVPIALNRQVHDVCDGSPEVLCSAVSNEPDEDTGDIRWIQGQLFLRAERSWKGKGRVYTITCTARDASQNVTQDSAQVSVPYDDPEK